MALAVLDECAFFSSEDSAAPDIETYRAILPGLTTLPGSMIVGISSPYWQRGLLYDKFRRHFGKPDDDVLVIKAPSTALNPTLDPAEIARLIEDDPEAGAAEWLAEFRRDVSGFVSREAVDAATVPGRIELPPVAGIRYVAFVDPSGGSADSMTLAVAHREDDGRVVLDAVRERRPPFSPEAAVAEFAELLTAYRVREVSGDRYAGEWPRERFREHGIEYRPSDKTKSDLYRELLPLLNAGKVELLENSRLATQLVALERRTARGGRDSIDHPPGAHDDLANAAAGAIVIAAPGNTMTVGRGIYGFMRE
ncbi:MAG TPA: hypothetical protein VFX03_10775, partial [Thermomicrobiales bacterium]|nr:hypothetical protein [Thermomicrobiales bacterium]